MEAAGCAAILAFKQRKTNTGFWTEGRGRTPHLVLRHLGAYPGKVASRPGFLSPVYPTGTGATWIRNSFSCSLVALCAVPTNKLRVQASETTQCFGSPSFNSPYRFIDSLELKTPSPRCSRLRVYRASCGLTPGQAESAPASRIHHCRAAVVPRCFGDLGTGFRPDQFGSAWHHRCHRR